jgi:hypothetical protein
MVGQEFRGQLSLIPVVPYAVSLSLSVAYRELRHSKVPMYRARARSQLQANCVLLQELGEIFWSASAMAEMGEQTVREMDRVVYSMTNPQQQKRVQDQTAPTHTVTSVQPDGHEGADKQAGMLTSSMEGNCEFIDGAIGRFPIGLENPESNVAIDNGTWKFDPSFFDNMPDLDVFGHFDPEFDLGAIDAALGSNLDLSFPTNFHGFM